MSFSNQDLLDYKKKALSSFEISIQSSLTFCFHGIELTINSDDSSFIEQLKDFVPKSWITSSCNFPHVIYHCTPPKDDMTWDEEASSLLYSYDENKKTYAFQRDFAAYQDKESDAVYAYFDPIIGDGFYNFFRWYLSEKLLSLNKMMLHSAAVLDHDHQVNVFLGPSGAGKTTVTEFSSPRLIIGDDMNMISVNEMIACAPGAVGGLYLPQVSLDQSFPIKSFYWLVQDDDHFVSPLPKIKQYQYLYASLANICWSGTSQNTLEKADQLINTTLKQFEIKELHFKKESQFWNHLS